MDVCVVGAGIIGAATGYHLALRGARVTVLDATARPTGASAATFGWINANGKQPNHYFELNRDAMDAHRELAGALGDDTWLHGGGSVEWSDAAGADALATRVNSHAALGYAAEMIDPARLRQLEPGLAPDPAPVAAAYFASEGWADSLALIDVLLSAARYLGAGVRLGVRVRRLEDGGGQRAKVLLESNGTIEADVVVNAGGAEAGILAKEAGLAVDTSGPVGLNAVTTPLRVGVGLSRVVRAPRVHFRPETGGRVMIASSASDSALAAGQDARDLAAGLVDTAARQFPALRDVSVQETRIARRAIPPDGLPIVGRTADVPWLYHVITHSGVTLAPLLGGLAAAEIVGDGDEDRHAPYRPARFVP